MPLALKLVLLSLLHKFGPFRSTGYANKPVPRLTDVLKRIEKSRFKKRILKKGRGPRIRKKL